MWGDLTRCSEACAGCSSKESSTRGRAGSEPVSGRSGGYPGNLRAVGSPRIDDPRSPRGTGSAENSGPAGGAALAKKVAGAGRPPRPRDWRSQGRGACPRRLRGRRPGGAGRGVTEAVRRAGSGTLRCRSQPTLGNTQGLARGSAPSIPGGRRSGGGQRRRHCREEQWATQRIHASICRRVGASTGGLGSAAHAVLQIPRHFGHEVFVVMRAPGHQALGAPDGGRVGRRTRQPATRASPLGDRLRTGGRDRACRAGGSGTRDRRVGGVGDRRASAKT